MAARKAHNLEVAGSNPASASRPLRTDRSEVSDYFRRLSQKAARQCLVEKEDRKHLEAIAVLAQALLANTIGPRIIATSEVIDPLIRDLRIHVDAIRESGLLKLLSAGRAASSENQVIRSPRRARHGQRRDAARR